MISVNDLKTGLTLELDNGLWSVVNFLHVKPGKGAAFVKTTLKKIETGQVVEKTFRAGEKVAKAMLDRREMQYLYKEGKEFVMKDAYTFDTDQESCEVAYQKQFQAYKNVFDRCGLEYKIVRADTGVMGGLLSEEFQAVTDIGEDVLVLLNL